MESWDYDPGYDSRTSPLVWAMYSRFNSDVRIKSIESFWKVGVVSDFLDFIDTFENSILIGTYKIYVFIFRFLFFGDEVVIHFS